MQDTNKKESSVNLKDIQKSLKAAAGEQIESMFFISIFVLGFCWYNLIVLNNTSSTEIMQILFNAHLLSFSFIFALAWNALHYLLQSKGVDVFEKMAKTSAAYCLSIVFLFAPWIAIEPKRFTILNFEDPYVFICSFTAFILAVIGVWSALFTSKETHGKWRAIKIVWFVALLFVIGTICAEFKVFA